jgi:hypothetical protein
MVTIDTTVPNLQLKFATICTFTFLQIPVYLKHTLTASTELSHLYRHSKPLQKHSYLDKHSNLFTSPLKHLHASLDTFKALQRPLYRFARLYCILVTSKNTLTASTSLSRHPRALTQPLKHCRLSKNSHGL